MNLELQKEIENFVEGVSLRFLILSLWEVYLIFMLTASLKTYLVVKIMNLKF